MTAAVGEPGAAGSSVAPRRPGMASPVTLPAAPAPATAWPPLLVAEPDPGPLRLLASLDDGLSAAQPDPAPPSGDVSRVVVGYLRAAATPSDPLTDLSRGTDVDDSVMAPLVAAISRYARERGLTLLRVHRDDVTDDDARRPGFSACLRHLYQREASAIVVPTWSHLAPNDVLRRALCHNATSAGGTIQVIDPVAG